MSEGDSETKFDDSQTGEYPSVPLSLQSGTFPVKRQTDRTGSFPAAGVNIKHGRKSTPDTDDYPALLPEDKLHREENSRHKKYKCLAEKNEERGKLEASARCLEKALYISIKENGPQHISVAMDLENIGTLLYKMHRTDSAQAMMERAARIKKAFE